MASILYCCGYTDKKIEEYLAPESNNPALKKLRSSAASVRIFKKHGWNKMESGWNGLF